MTATQTSLTDPRPVKLMSDGWLNTDATVGAFDITVTDEKGDIQTGRTYARYLALNMGSNSTVKEVEGQEVISSKVEFCADFYIATADGYVYHTLYNLDPFGFIFFCNNRGILYQQSDTSTYFSVKGVDQVSGTAAIDLKDYMWRNPDEADTFLDETQLVFFEKPGNLPDTILPKAMAPEIIEDFVFEGAKENNITYVGAGGFFRFTNQRSTAVTITLDFTDYNSKHGTSFQNTTITSPAVPGVNRIYWDGKDGKGETLPAGWYKDGSIRLYVETRAGEFHFPLLDVENSFGIQIERVNEIYDYKIEGETKTLQIVTQNYSDDRYRVYYDNETKKDPQTGQILNNFFQGKEEEAGKTPIGDGLSHPNGIDTSQNPVLIYQRQYGDCTAIDLWTYTAKTNTQSIEANLIIEDLDQYLSAALEGLVFYDANKNHLYDTAHQDYPLAGWTVLLDCEYAETRWQVPGGQAETFPDILYPAYHRKEETSPSDGDSSEESTSSLTVDYYYHHFMLKKAKTGEMDGSDFCTYLLFQYDQTDLQHQREPKPVMDQEKQVQVQVHRMQSTQTGGTSDEYLSSRYVAWIPIHKETQTLATGMYVFSGILVHPETITQDQARKMETRSVKVEVVRQRKDYELSTQQMNTHSSFSTMGEEIQQFFWQDLVGKVNEDHQNNPQEINFTYRLADVGYYEPVYVLPETGGITAQTFQLAGAGLLILAFFLARTNRKKKADWE